MAKAALAEHRPSRRQKKRRREIQHYGLSHDAPAWTGPVVRLDDLTDDERAALGAYPRHSRPRSVHLTWRCVNPYCGHWTMNGAHRTGRCNFCFEPRPRAPQPPEDA